MCEKAKQEMLSKAKPKGNGHSHGHGHGPISMAEFDPYIHLNMS